MYIPMTRAQAEFRINMLNEQIRTRSAQHDPSPRQVAQCSDLRLERNFWNMLLLVADDEPVPKTKKRSSTWWFDRVFSFFTALVIVVWFILWLLGYVG